ncbi:hypothetical protein SHIRM173S_02398 [Streptomyces hirsutus]
MRSFSSLRMADGPLIVHDFERLDRSPYRIILSCCDTARLRQRGRRRTPGPGHGVAAGCGTAGVVACSAPVNDAAVVPLMLALHQGLDTGLSLAEALRDAPASLPGDAVHRATQWAFSAFGAGLRPGRRSPGSGGRGSGGLLSPGHFGRAGGRIGRGSVSRGRAVRSLAPRRV